MNIKTQFLRTQSQHSAIVTPIKPTTPQRIVRSLALTFTLAAFLPSVALSAAPGSWSSKECVGVDTTCTPGPTSAGVVFDNGMESSSDLPTASGHPLYSLSTAGAGYRERSTTHRREGSYSVLQRVTKNGTTNYRTELRIQSRTDDVAQENSRDYWLGISVYIPSSTSLNSQSVLLQWHNILDTTNNRSPTIGIRVENGAWKMTREVGSFSGASLGPVATNEWTDWVFRVRWRPDRTGLIEVWKNGTRVIGGSSWTNIQTASSTDWQLPFFKFGRYSSSWKFDNSDADGTVHESYHDAMRICYGDTCGYSDVAPRGDRLAAR